MNAQAEQDDRLRFEGLEAHPTVSGGIMICDKESGKETWILAENPAEVKQ